MTLAPALVGPVDAIPIGLLKPNVVVFYLDDTNPTDGRLWNDPALTPNLYDLFVAHGIHVENAFGETPLCCPSRATLLTGLHTHNHRVIVNDARLFDPSENVGKEMTNSGYQSMLIGKYMNLPNLLTAQQWDAVASGWSQFDAFSSPNTNAGKYFYDYTMFTKQGQLAFGHDPQDHSTRVIADRAVTHLQEADPAKPVFEILSLFNTHAPNIPMPGLEQDPRWGMCDSMPPWKPPNYNEADVSDKPPYVRQQAPQPYANGWPMAGLCRETLGVDWVVGRVVDELKSEGRFDNTMFMFAADNGMAWGQHRLGQEKQSPYATRVPLYFSWQARWGTEPRTVSEYVSDIDFAPTLCDVGRCSLGPYPGGQEKPDGISLLPLLDGNVTSLGRDALLEDSFETRDWGAVRTTPESDLGLWHYIEYPTGFVELYDDAADPWELNNLASAGYGELKAALHDRLFELLAEGRPDRPARLTIVADSVPNSAQDMSFSSSFGPFVLDDDAEATLPSRITFDNVAPGAYSFSETLPAGWVVTGIDCPFPAQPSPAGGTLTVHLFANDDLVCTFHNSGHVADAVVGLLPSGAPKGATIFSKKPVPKQTVRRASARAGAQYEFNVTVLNNDNAAKSYGVTANIKNSAGMAAALFVDGTDVTAQVAAGTYRTPAIDPGSAFAMVVRVTVDQFAVSGDQSVVTVRVLTSGSRSILDVVRAVTVR